MRIKNVHALHTSVTNVVLFTETTKEDYFFNHVLSLVADTDDTETEIKNRLYDALPDQALVSDRQCAVRAVKLFKGDYEYEQSRTTGRLVYTG